MPSTSTTPSRQTRRLLLHVHLSPHGKDGPFEHACKTLLYPRLTNLSLRAYTPCARPFVIRPCAHPHLLIAPTLVVDEAFEPLALSID